MKAFSLTSLHPNTAYQGKPTQPSFLRGQEEYPLGVRAEGESPRTSIWLSFFPEQAETTITEFQGNQHPQVAKMVRKTCSHLMGH